jgi:hypothetical protein
LNKNRVLKSKRKRNKENVFNKKQKPRKKCKGGLNGFLMSKDLKSNANCKEGLKGFLVNEELKGKRQHVLFW